MLHQYCPAVDKIKIPARQYFTKEKLDISEVPPPRSQNETDERRVNNFAESKLIPTHKCREFEQLDDPLVSVELQIDANRLAFMAHPILHPPLIHAAHQGKPIREDQERPRIPA